MSFPLTGMGVYFLFLEYAVNRLQDKVALITGAAQGLGLASALAIAQQGATVVIADKQKERGSQAAAEISRIAGSRPVEFIYADLSGKAGIESLANAFLSRFDRLDILLNNVGETNLFYRESPEGYEMTWAVNYLSHFYLTLLLLPCLKQTAATAGEARIVEITSHTSQFSRPVFSPYPRHQRFFTPVDGVMAYSLSKRALLTFIYGLNKRLTGTGVSINAVTPGWTRTGMANNNGPFWQAVMDFLRLFMQPVEAGIQPIIHLATAPEMHGISGCYYRRFELMPPNATWASDAVADQLWEMSDLMLDLTGRSQ